VIFTACREGKSGTNRYRSPVAWTPSRWRVNPLAASVGRSWRRRAATIPAEFRRLPSSSWNFRGYFVIL